MPKAIKPNQTYQNSRLSFKICCHFLLKLLYSSVFLYAFAVFATLASSKSPGLLELADGKFFPLMKPEARKRRKTNSGWQLWRRWPRSLPYSHSTHSCVLFAP